MSLYYSNQKQRIKINKQQKMLPWVYLDLDIEVWT